MYAGELIETAPVGELFENPRHPYTRGLLASIPGRTVHGDRLPTIEGEVPTPTTEPTYCRFAPRCDYSFEECHRVHPKQYDVGEDHEAACLLYDDRFPQEPPSGGIDAVLGGDER